MDEKAMFNLDIVVAAAARRTRAGGRRPASWRHTERGQITILLIGETVVQS